MKKNELKEKISQLMWLSEEFNLMNLHSLSEGEYFTKFCGTRRNSTKNIQLKIDKHYFDFIKRNLKREYFELEKDIFENYSDLITSEDVQLIETYSISN